MSVWVRDIVCKQAVELVSDYLEGALPPRARRRLERHLANCDACTAYLAQMRASIAATGAVGPDDLDDATLDGLTELYRSYMEDPS